MTNCEIGIVGGSGFVGSSLARHLGERFKVRVIDKRMVPEDLRNRVDFQQCDITNYDEVRQKVSNVDLLIFAAIVQIPSINVEKLKGYEVNVLGVQNICEVARNDRSTRGVILTGSWHVFGDKGFQRINNEEFAFRPDTVEGRAKYYTLTKIAQETIVRIYDEMSDKIYGTIRMGTVLGNGMPEKSAASIFITQGLKGEAITPYRHSMYRRMFYVDINDVCEGFTSYVKKILKDEVEGNRDSLAHIVNLTYPKSVTILELATIVKDAIKKQTSGEIRPEIRILDKGLPCSYSAKGESAIVTNEQKAKRFLGLKKTTSPKEAIERIVAGRVKASKRTSNV